MSLNGLEPGTYVLLSHKLIVMWNHVNLPELPSSANRAENARSAPGSLRYRLDTADGYLPRLVKVAGTSSS